MAIAVTGAAGYLGRWLVAALVDLGCTVRALDRVRADVPGAQWIQADIRDEAALGLALEGADVVFHLAAVIELRGLAPKAVREHVWPLLENGTVAPVIHKTFPLADAAAAHRLMEESTHIGKLVLIV